MKSTLILALAALSVNTNAKALKARQDPVVFTYNISQDGTCASLPFSPAKEFRRSQIPKNGCVVLSSLAAGNSTPAAPVTAFLFVRAFPPSGVCRRMFFFNSSFFPFLYFFIFIFFSFLN